MEIVDLQNEERKKKAAIPRNSTWSKRVLNQFMRNQRNEIKMYDVQINWKNREKSNF